MNKRQISIFFIVFLFFNFFIFSQNTSVKIPALNSKDSIFKEFSYIVADNYKLLAAGKSPDIIFFSYTVPDDESTLFSIASRCNISYDTIATLNGIENISTEIKGKTLIIPTAPGLFIKTGKCNNSLEIILKENYFSSSLTKNCLYYIIDGEEYVYLIDCRFSPTERAYFLDSELALPLDKNTFWVSSDFGKRKNPFSGEWKNHKGIDLAAAEGTPVFAIKDGDIAFCIENDKTFGNYIIISHDKGSMTSVYAHLSKIIVQKYISVKKGDIIGYVGSTGMATGPHLHFEIRQGGIPQDPKNKLKLE